MLYMTLIVFRSTGHVFGRLSLSLGHPLLMIKLGQGFRENHRSGVILITPYEEDAANMVVTIDVDLDHLALGNARQGFSLQSYSLFPFPCFVRSSLYSVTVESYCPPS